MIRVSFGIQDKPLLITPEFMLPVNFGWDSREPRGGTGHRKGQVIRGLRCSAPRPPTDLRGEEGRLEIALQRNSWARSPGELRGW